MLINFRNSYIADIIVISLSNAVVILGLFLVLTPFTACTAIPPPNPKIATLERIAQIQINKSSKDDVLSYLGLPHKRQVHRVDVLGEVEYWIYFRGRGEKVSVYFDTVTKRIDIFTINYAYISSVLTDKELKEIAVVIAFNEQGRVIDVVTDNEQ